MVELKQSSKGDKTICLVKGRKPANTGIGNGSPFAKKMMEVYKEFGLPEPQKLKECKGYKKLEKIVKEAGLSGIALEYAPVGLTGQSRNEYIPIHMTSFALGEVRIAPETVLITDALLKVFPELVEIGARSMMIHEKEHCQGPALKRAERLTAAITAAKGSLPGSELEKSWLDIEMMTTLQQSKTLVMLVKEREKFAEELAYDFLFHFYIYAQQELVLYYSSMRKMEPYSRFYPFLKEGVVDAAIKKAEEAREELKERIESLRFEDCNQDVRNALWTANEVKMRIKSLR